MNPFDHLRPYTKTFFLEQVTESMSVDQINGYRAIAGGLIRRLVRKVARGDKQSFIRASLRGSTKIPDFLGSDVPLPAFALEVDLK